jgi:hypothetical protein
MSYVMVSPELIQAAATELAAIGSTLSAAHAIVAPSTVAVLPAAADEVSASIAQLMSGYGQEYQKLAGEAAAFHEQFVQRFTRSADSYRSAEAANVALLRRSTEIANPPVSAAASIPTSGEELGSQVVNSIFWGFITIFVGIPVILLILGLAYFAPGILLGVGALMNGRG